MKKMVSALLLCILGVVGLMANGQQDGGDSSAPIKLVLADTGAGENSPITVAGTAWKKAIEEASSGKIVVDYFTNSQLGGERDLMEGLQAGTIDLYIGSTGVASQFVPELGALNLPFLFLNKEHCDEAQFGPLGERLVAYIDNAEGLKGMAIGGAGWRMPMNKTKEINSLDDFKGLKWRCMGVPMHMDTYTAMGASPIPVAFTELYTALQLGTVDGHENAPSILYPMGFHEVCGYLTTLPVLLNGDVFVMSKSKWETLSAEQQQIVKDASIIAAKALNQAFVDEDEKAIVAMKEYGVEVYRMTTEEMKPFVEATKSVWDKYLPTFSEDVQEIAIEMQKLGEKY